MDKRIIVLPPVLLAFLLTGCLATAPVTIAWRSNTSQQYATTDGRATKAADSNTVNADRTTENQAAVTTSSGSASTAEQFTEQKASAPDSAALKPEIPAISAGQPAGIPETEEDAAK